MWIYIKCQRVPCPLGIYSVSWVEQPTMELTPGPAWQPRAPRCVVLIVAGLSRVCWRDVIGQSLEETKEGLQGKPWFPFLAVPRGTRILIPWPGWNPCPCFWKPRVLITAPLGEVLWFLLNKLQELVKVTISNKAGKWLLGVVGPPRELSGDYFCSTLGSGSQMKDCSRLSFLFLKKMYTPGLHHLISLSFSLEATSIPKFRESFTFIFLYFPNSIAFDVDFKH